jgi:quinoprotein glucose dehydrogenase
VNNVKGLKLTWEYELDTTDIGSLSIPIVVDDGTGRNKSVLVIVTRYTDVIALDPETGKVKWRCHDFYTPDNLQSSYYIRGVSYWDNPSIKEGELCKSTLFTVTGDFRIGAIDAATGKLCSHFGNNGSVLVADNHPTWCLKNPPTVINGVLAVSPKVDDGIKQNFTLGYTWAFDAATGERLWTWCAIPTPSDPVAYSTWLNGTENFGNANVWPVMTGDSESNLILMNVGSASPDWYGGGRPGDNLYTGCLVAVNASSGSIKWYFQTVRHDIWDLDGGTQVSITHINGKKSCSVWNKERDALDIRF